MGDGGERGGEVQKDASAVRLREGGNHGGGVDLEKVGEYGSSAEESLLARKDPFGEVAFPSAASGRCNDAVVTVDNAKWACVVE